MSTIIEMKSIRKTYQIGTHFVEALKHVDFQVNKGDLLSIVGSSGSGKSTLMNIIGLLDNPDSGNYLLNGRDVAQLTGDDRAIIRNETIGFVFQSFFLLPRLTAIQNVSLPLLYRGTPAKERFAKALKMLDRVSMKEFASHHPNQLSGGQQQRVAIARALVGHPTIILADEPTGALDSKIGQEVMNIFKELNDDEGVSTIIITHDNHVAEQCKRVIRIHDGDIVSQT